MLQSAFKLTPFAKSLIRDPRVLNCAWSKVDDWYKNEQRPEPEYSSWRHNPRPHLINLAEELISGRYAPSKFPLIPYPKKGGKIRHYTQPSVKDQVAFTLLGTILAPLFEARFSNISYGNRWFRGIELRSSLGSNPQWKANPYYLSDKNLNLPFARSYGLFRRIAHWRARTMLRDDKNIDASLSHLKESDFDPALLAYSGAKFSQSSKRTVYYTRLDLSKAYPTVDRTIFTDVVLKTLTAGLPDRRYMRAAFYKGSIWEQLEFEHGRTSAYALTKLWMEMLSHVTFSPGTIGMAWHDELSESKYPQEYADNKFGIPTGLAVSGLLFNIYLNEFDHLIKQRLTKQTNLYNGIALRFVDDFILIGTSKRHLQDLLVFTEGYFDTNGPRPRLSIGWGKARPASLPELLESDRGLKESLSTVAAEKFWDDAKITPDNLKEFVTDLVEELSELGSESLDDLMGDHGETRLKQLHDLINIERHDEEVKDDTRIAFAASRLSRHPIPFWLDSENSIEESLVPQELSRIRSSVSQAITEAPWKFRIWQAAIAAAMRVDPRARGTGINSLSRSMRWLENILRKISIHGEWEKHFPGSEHDGKMQSHRNRLATSFLRTYFWKALARTIKSFSFAHELGGHYPHIKEKWRPKHWAWYVLPEESLKDVYLAIADIPRWATILYKNQKINLDKWEHDALIEATLAASTWRDIFESTDIGQVGKDECDFITELVNRFPRNVSKGINQQSPIFKSLDAVLGLSQSIGYLDERELGRLISATKPKSRIDVLLCLENSGALNYLTESAFQTIAHSIIDCQKFINPIWLPHYYHSLRNFCLSNGSTPPVLNSLAKQLFPTWKKDETNLDIYWLLWSNKVGRKPAPEATPAIGLPPGIVQLMLRDGLQSAASTCYSWELNASSTNILHWGRLSQLDILMRDSPPMIENQNLISASTSASLPPHASFLVRNSKQWSNGLIALISLTGNERILDSIWNLGPEPIPISERLAWRSQALAPRAYWQFLEKLLSDISAENVQHDLFKYIEENLIIADWKKTPTEQISDLFSFAFTDINLKSGDFSESPQSPHKPAVTPESTLRGVHDTLLVRVAQLREHPEWKTETATREFPTLPQRRCLELISNFLEALPDYNELRGKAEKPELLVGPEVFLPYDPSLIRLLRNASKKRNLATLIGLYWHEVPFAITPSRRKTGHTRYFVNEALLLVPITHPGNTKPHVVREFRIPKPLPAAQEYGLAEALTQECSGGLSRTKEWKILGGTRWYCFRHPDWGRFSVAICSDLLDPIPWALMRQRLQHLFMIAHNKDIDLYQSITWSRAYECYVNLVAVNHGSHGGSFSWTPKHSHQKEVVILRGSELNVVVDLRLEVRALIQEQRTGWARSVEHYTQDWLSDEKKKSNPWKTPPHNFKLLE